MKKWILRLNRRWWACILVCFIVCTNSTAQVFQGYSGGMMLHTGYLFGPAEAPKASDWRGATMGIGGALRINLWDHLRVGGEGYVSTMPSTLSNQSKSLANGSYVRNGWGGILADACWRLEKIWPYIGGSIGGGSCKSLYIYDGDQHDWQAEADAIFNKQAYWYVDPYVGVDWCMTKKVHLTFKMDWLLAIHDRRLLMPTGTRAYIGFMFCH